MHNNVRKVNNLKVYWFRWSKYGKRWCCCPLKMKGAVFLLLRDLLQGEEQHENFPWGHQFWYFYRPSLVLLTKAWLTALLLTYGMVWSSYREGNMGDSCWKRELLSWKYLKYLCGLHYTYLYMWPQTQSETVLYFCTEIKTD